MASRSRRMCPGLGCGSAEEILQVSGPGLQPRQKRCQEIRGSHQIITKWMKKKSRAPAGRGCASALECFFSTTRPCVSPHPSTAKNNIKIKINHIWPVVTVKKEWGKGRDRFQVVQFLFYFWNFCPNSRLDRVNLNPINCQVKVECSYVRREQHSEGQWAD